MEWYEAVERVTPYVVRISTPQGSGTGFLVTRAATGGMIGIATAAHVIDHAHYWEQPVRFQRAGSSDSVLVRPADRAIVLDEQRDTAVILMEEATLSFPGDPLPLIEEGYSLKIGNPIGWLGYPAIGGAHLCFFTGTVSAWVKESGAYFVDGVAINGVSGGPAFATYGTDLLELIGVVSAYMPNRVTGETLPGLGVVRDVTQFHEMILSIKNLDEAKDQETPATEVPPPAPDASTEPGSATSVRRVP